MSRSLNWMKGQFLHVLPAVLFFFVAFMVIDFTTELMVKKHSITISTVPAIAIGAYIVGKVLLVVDSLPFINIFSSKPLIYGTLWKTAIYSFSALLFRLVEKLAPFVAEYKELAPAFRHFVNELDWPRFWAVQIWVALVFFIFVLFRELARAIGEDRMRKMFFG